MFQLLLFIYGKIIIIFFSFFTSSVFVMALVLSYERGINNRVVTIPEKMTVKYNITREQRKIARQIKGRRGVVQGFCSFTTQKTSEKAVIFKCSEIQGNFFLFFSSASHYFYFRLFFFSEKHKDVLHYVARFALFEHKQDIPILIFVHECCSLRLRNVDCRQERSVAYERGFLILKLYLI